MRWRKIQSGEYELLGTDFKVAASYEATSSDDHYARTGAETVGLTEWAAIRVSRDENLSWHDTMREAKAAAESFARREQS